MKIAVLDDFQDVVRHLDCFASLRGHSVKVLQHTARGVGQQAARLSSFEALVLIRDRSHIKAELVARLPNLRLICQTGKVGPHLDLDACTRRGIAVTESAGHAQATAEMTWLLILAALRRLPAYMANLYAGNWQQSFPARAHWPLAGFGESLAGKTLGVWGFGRIGQLVAAFGRAFAMQVLVHGRAPSLDAATAAGFAVTPSRAGFFSSSDVLTVHLRLLDATRGCVTGAELACMKPTALFVNTSRAELVAPGALVDALRAGRPGLAAVDVFEKEPVQSGEPLLTLPSVICTPHLGFTERASYERLLGGAFANLVAFVAGKPANVANPEALGRSDAAPTA
jgi:D-3-phosphoglycerate dehydrogenase